jgi:hypothetical protein
MMFWNGIGSEIRLRTKMFLVCQGSEFSASCAVDQLPESPECYIICLPVLPNLYLLITISYSLAETSLVFLLFVSRSLRLVYEVRGVKSFSEMWDAQDCITQRYYPDRFPVCFP